MYFWKCWRDLRGRFIVYLTALPMMVILSAVVASIVWVNPALKSGTPRGEAAQLRPKWKFVRSAPRGGDVANAWDNTFRIGLEGACSPLIALAGLSLGAMGAGQEFEQGTIEFLLTRPRRRRYFIWAGWAFGAFELLTIVTLTVLAGFASLIYLTGAVYAWKLLGMVVPLFILGAVAFSLTYFLSTLARNTRTGLSLGLGLVLISVLLPPAIRYWWQIHVPSLTDLFLAGNWAMDARAHFPVGAVVGWGVVALVFGFAAQVFFERAEA